MPWFPRPWPWERAPDWGTRGLGPGSHSSLTCCVPLGGPLPLSGPWCFYLYIQVPQVGGFRICLALKGHYLHRKSLMEEFVPGHEVSESLML